MRWWADDSDFQSEDEVGTPDVFVFGGLIVPEGKEDDLVKRVHAVKQKYGHSLAPIKWNFKSAFDLYGKSEHSQAIHASMKANSNHWRSEVFDVLADSDITIVMAAIAAYSSDKTKVLEVRSACERRAFSNALMRYALFAKHKGERAELVIDWPAKADRDPFNQEYGSAYRTGMTSERVRYHSGPLCAFGMADSVMFSSTKHSCMLQLADMVVGASRDFLRAVLTKQEYGPGFAMLKKVKDRLNGAPHKIVGRGLNVSTGNGEFRGR